MNPVKTLRSLGPRYTALWIGQTISQFGTYIYVLTLPLLVRHIQLAEGKGLETLDFSITYALEFIPTFLVGLAAGVFLDRLHLRPVMIAADLLRACAFFYLAAQVGSYGLGVVFLMAFLLGSLTTFFDGALYAMIPSIVPRDRLSDANSWVTASIQANFAIGPAVAGLFAWLFAGPEVGLFVNGVTFVASAISLIWVGRVPHHRTAEDERVGFFTEAANGIKYVFGEPRLRITTIAAAVPNFVIGFFEATILVLAQVVLLTTTELEFGVLVSAMGVGGVIGALVSPRVTRRLGLGRAMTVGMALTGVCMLALMFTTYGVLAILLQAGWMIGVSVINVPLATIRQYYAKESMLGRVISASRAIGWATLPVGAMLGGWLGATPDTYPWVARIFPLLVVATAIWLATTVIWGDTFGPDFRGAPKKEKEPATG